MGDRRHMDFKGSPGAQHAHCRQPPAATIFTHPPTWVVLREEVALLLQARQLQQVLHQLSVLVAEGGQDDDMVLHSMHGMGAASCHVMNEHRS